MRATAIRLPVRQGKQHLLASCAIAAGIVALAYGGPALAQVAANPVPGLVGPGGGVNSVGTTTTVTVTQAQNIYNWVPTDTAATGGDIDLLPNGSTWNFVGPAGYTVLNRFVNGVGGSLSRQIAINGTVNSYVGSTTGPRGGNIWFYNAGGILIGATGVINVGSLVLTTNDIVTTGGLFGPGGTIRFNGASGSTSAITVNGAINANNVGNPGSSYVALVAPRVVQAGAVRVDGSAAYVAAEQAEVRINGGLFDINVTVGAAGGNAITHTGSTTGPAHQDGDTDQSRIYMVAIPKNDAVTMLVSGSIGYDDAVSAVEADGAVRLSAGYNIVAGELATAPVNATAANMTINDTLFRSDTIARASGALVGQPLLQLPPPVLPFAPPPHIGRVVVEGNGNFIGDASATFNVGAGQLVGATGNFTVQSGGTAGAAGNSSVNVNGGQFGVGGNLAITATGALDATSGDSQGGIARLNVNSGGVALITGGAIVSANGIAGVDTGGNGGDGRGGTAEVLVSGTGSVLSANLVLASASGQGGGLSTNPSGATVAGDVGGSGVGGTATVTVENGGSLSATQGLGAFAIGQGQVGLDQSGDGTGGTARISVTGAGTNVQTLATIVNASGTGGGNISNPSVGTFTTLDAGDGIGGQASIEVNAAASATISFGTTSVSGEGEGGGASGDSSASGNGRGGAASVSVTGGDTVQFADLTLTASGFGGGDGSGLDTIQSGDGIGGNVNVSATGGSTLDVGGTLSLAASGMAATSNNMGSGEGGNVIVSATGGGTIDVADQIFVDAFGGSTGLAVIADNVGSGTGGDVIFTADGGTISADGYQVDASAATVNSRGAGGPAQGGTISFTASNAGRILTTNDGSQFFDAGARSGASAAGSNATGGTIQFIANAGTIDMGLGSSMSASGISGGAIESGGTNPVGTGGTILIRTVAEATDSSSISLGEFNGSADGFTEVDVEGGAGVPNQTLGAGRGGTMTIEVQGGTLSASSLNATASGYGGNGPGDASNGTGGTATFTQTGGIANVGDMTISADGFGGVVQGQSGIGIGGTATINLLGGTINAADIVAQANGEGGIGSFGSDEDPANILPGGNGGNGAGGTATINIEGSAIVNASTILANAAGIGGEGGEFDNVFSFSGDPGTPGNGGDGIGGTAVVNVRGGTTAASSMIADASGIGGAGGSSFFSSSSGGVTGVGTGGTGGAGRGGTATIALEMAVEGISNVSAVAQGLGGVGGSHNVGGNGGDGFGGIAQAIVTNFEAGELAVTLDASGRGGHGADGNDGNGGNGGNGAGGTARMLADGPDASLTVVQTNFLSEGIGGNGGNGNRGFGSFPMIAPSGGNGGNGTGGTIEVAANEGGTVSLGLIDGDSVVFSSIGRGGNGGNGADSVFSATAQAGNGGNGGGGNGGTIRLVTTGGTISSNGEAVDIDTTGESGAAGVGGAGQGGGSNGANGGISGTRGGLVAIEALNGESGLGRITLGATNISASGDIAGRVELRSEGELSFAGLDAEVLGFAAPTNNDTDEAPAGIFVALNGGTISSQGDVTLTTDSSVGVYAQSNGILDVDGVLTIDAGDQVDIRHDAREGTAPTIRASDSVIVTALNSISAAPGSTLGAGDALSLTTSGVTGSIGVDRLDAVGDISIASNGAVSVEHAEAGNDFTATAGSFRTGLNSIITGGDITITSPGAVDLGNSSAGGFVQVQGQSIVFNTIDAGLTVNLSASGDMAGAEGIRGASIDAGGDISLFANSIALTGNVTGTGSFFAFGIGGPVAVNNADVDGTISIFSDGDMTGTYVSGGDIRLNSNANINVSARANGGYVDPSGVGTANGDLFVEAVGNATLTNSAAARMFGVNSGGAATITGGTAGEDMLVRAGTTASLTGVTAGDDLTILAVGDITANDARTTGAGGDTRTLAYAVGSSGGVFTISVGEGTSSTNGADIVMASSAGAIDAAALSAGDDILLNAANSIAVNGATTLGLGITGGDSSLRTQGGTTTLGNVDAFSDVIVDAAGAANLDGPVAAGRDVTINAASVTLATLSNPGGAIDTLTADRDIVINSAGGITGGGTQAFGAVSLQAGAAIDVTSVGGASVTLSGDTGITADQVSSSGETSLDSIDGNILIGSLVSSGTIAASANAIRIEGGGTQHFTTLTTDVGDAYVRGNGDFSVASGNVAGTADLGTSGEAMSIANLTAANAILSNTGGFLNLQTVTATGSVAASARSNLGITGVVTGQSISLDSGNIDIASTGRVGTAGVTQQVSIANNNADNQTFVGGTAGQNGPNGYHIDAAELTRVFGREIEILAPEVQAGGGSTGTAAPPDVVVDAFTMTGGTSGSNLGAEGSLTIRTPGKMRVIGNVQLTGLTNDNSLNLFGDESVEVIMGSGSVNLRGQAPDQLAGNLTIRSDDIVIATMQAINDIAAMTSTSAINARLAQNDGITNDIGALSANRITLNHNLTDSVYIQNSGTGTAFDERRGITFGAGGLFINGPGNQDSLVINAVHRDASGGLVTGLAVIPLVNINAPSGSTGVVQTGFNAQSTINGCLIANPAACTTVTVDFETSFPVQDVVEEETETDEGDGNTLPQPLITMRDLDPLTGEPLLDDPVTGAGNDDLWTTPTETP